MGAGGRPTDFRDIYCDQAYKLCLLGYKDKDLAFFFNTSEQTINAWKKQFPLFLESLKKGKDIADAEVVASLHRRATGYRIETEKVFQFQGEIVRADTVEEIAPDTGACALWLKNRQPEKWRDKRDVEITGKLIIFEGEELEE